MCMCMKSLPFSCDILMFVCAFVIFCPLLGESCFLVVLDGCSFSSSYHDTCNLEWNSLDFDCRQEHLLKL